MNTYTAEQRAELIRRRRETPKNDYDFAPFDGYCTSCGFDLVSHHGGKYPEAWITGCRQCARSYVD